MDNSNTQIENAEVIADEIPHKKGFADTATAAKLSGEYNMAVGKIKKTIAGLTDNTELRNAGRDQELKGKLHRLVGSIRGVREQAFNKFSTTRKETQQICIKHGGRLLDVATDFIEDLKKALLK